MQALERGDPRAIGRYRLLARLGTGGMAIVYFGRSPGRRAVAVKVMHADLAADPAYRERFRTEVTATAAAAGRYCPAVVDADPNAPVPWLATEFLPAVSLRDAVHDHGPLPSDAVWPLAAGLAEALASIHRAGVVHLDVKPANVLLTLDGPRIIDFGIAGGRAEGVPAGSWGFMSPEQVAGGRAGAASDVYSFGVTVTFAGTGSRDVGGLGGVADGELRELIARCVRQDPDERPTVADLLRAAGGRRASGMGWLPAGIRADIDRRAGEARNPPVALPPALPRKPVRRRTLLVAGGGISLVAAGAAAWVLRPDAAPVDESGTVASSAPATPSVSPAATSASALTRTVEIYAYGRTTVKTLTSVINGQSETVPGAPLPYRRVVPVPPEPAPLTWRFAYRCTSGLFNWVITIDGVPVGGRGASSTSGEISDDVSGP